MIRLLLIVVVGNIVSSVFGQRMTHRNDFTSLYILDRDRHNNFEISLDVEENIISLCCNCHKQIHLGQGYEDMLKEIYTARKRLLKKVGIDISLENLILYYKMESK